MPREQLIHADLTFYNVEGSSKKKVLENIAHHVAHVIPSYDANELFDNFIARERLSSTGMGYGVAIPHCRLENCAEMTCVLVKLDKPVDFDAPDGEQVDLLFLLIGPLEATQEHLETLAQAAELFQSEELRNQLRLASSATALYENALAFMQSS